MIPGVLEPEAKASVPGGQAIWVVYTFTVGLLNLPDKHTRDLSV